MKLKILHLTITLIVLGTVATAQNFKRIKTEANFRALVVDRKLTSDDAGWMIVKSDGKTEGHILGQKFNAAWVWNKRMYCRNAVLGKKQLGTDCQVVKISGKTVQFIRKYGKGGTGEMKLP